MKYNEMSLTYDKIIIDENTNVEELKELILMLQGIIKRKDEVILDIKNSYIRLENSMNLIEEKIEYYSVYKKLCEIILDKINKNPISALWFLRSVKKKIEDFNKEC